MVRTILVNLRNYGQWLLAAATFVARTERTVVALTPPPLVIAQRLFLLLRSACGTGRRTGSSR
jgi:hypothetical protein